jgi:hypothetical protein
MTNRPTEMREHDAANEFVGAALGDERLGRRLATITERLAAAPDAPFPRALATSADLEGFYRFVANEAVTPKAVLGPHVNATVNRAAGYREVLAVHDTSEFRFGGSREDLGRLTKSGRGFLGHFTLLVTADIARDPLGTIALETWARPEVTPTTLRKQGKLTPAAVARMPNEHDRWWRAVKAAEEAVGNATSLIHVMDSEADDYDLMSSLAQSNHRWVIRLCRDRQLAGISAKTKEAVAEAEIVCERTVDVSRRQRQPGGDKRKRSATRDERTARLAISGSVITFQRPTYSQSGPETLAVNIVAVRELACPKDVEPVEWLLITTEPIAKKKDLLKIIDIYRGRWRIEEFYKALKTGCAIEKRQLDSLHTLLNALALFVPIAWRLLRLRAVAREENDTPASVVLDADEITVLRRAARTPLPRVLTARDAMLGIALLGGHLPNNGDPGWLVLGRGYQDLLMMVAGYRLASKK